MTVTAVAAALGSPPAVDAARDLAARHASPVTAATLTGFPDWNLFGTGAPAAVVAGVALKLIVLVAVTGPLCGLAGRGSRPAAFLGGWAATMVAAAAAGAAQFAFEDAALERARGALPLSYVDNLVSAAHTGSGFGLWTGWVVGIAVAATARVPSPAARGRVPVPTEAARPTAPPAVTPPAPWWAADTSPLSPLSSLLSGSSTGAGPPGGVVDVREPMRTTRTAADGSRVDVELDHTLATPLARRAPPREAAGGDTGSAGRRPGSGAPVGPEVPHPR